MKKIFVAALAALGCLIPAKAETFEYNPGAFDKIVIRADLNVVYRNVPDSAGYIRYDADKNFDDKLDVTYNKGKITVTDRMTDEDYGNLPTLYMYSDYLVSVVYEEGNGTLDVDLKCATPTFSAKLVGNGKIICNGINTNDFSANIVTGNGTIVASGECRDASFKITGTGLIQADRLVADNVNCTVLGTGSIGCRPINKLDVRGLGSTKIYYYGNPIVKKVGGAKLEQMPDSEDDNAINERAAGKTVRFLEVKEEVIEEVEEIED